MERRIRDSASVTPHDLFSGAECAPVELLEAMERRIRDSAFIIPQGYRLCIDPSGRYKFKVRTLFSSLWFVRPTEEATRFPTRFSGTTMLS